MPRQNLTSHSAPDAVAAAVRVLGANIQTARLRRRWTVEEVEEMAGISRETLARAESGRLTTGIGVYATLLWAMGLEGAIAKVAEPAADAEGETLAAARLGERARRAGTLSDDF
jgi:transcriptional regulator with XRE-family HTH domain